MFFGGVYMTSNINTQELKKKALKAIQKNNLIIISEVPPYLGIGRTSYYNHGLDKDEELKDALEKNRVENSSTW